MAHLFPSDLLRLVWSALPMGIRKQCRLVCSHWRNAMDEGTAFFLSHGAIPDAGPHTRRLVLLPRAISELSDFAGAARAAGCQPETLVLCTSAGFRGAC